MPSLGLLFKALPYGLALGAFMWGLYQANAFHACVAARNQDIIRAERAAREAESAFNDKERAKTAEIEERHRAELNAVRKEAKSREDAIIRIKVSGARDCAPFDALFDSLQRTPSAPGGRDPKAPVRKPD